MNEPLKAPSKVKEWWSWARENCWAGGMRKRTTWMSTRSTVVLALALAALAPLVGCGGGGGPPSATRMPRLRNASSERRRSDEG
jgi:hypothetical protein